MRNLATSLCAILVVVVCLDGSAQPGGDPSSYRSPGPRHKVQVDTPDDAKSMEAAGGDLVADYGTFKLYDVPAEPGKNVSVAGKLRDDHNIIYLHDLALDTRSTRAAELKSRGDKAASGKGGRMLHLVQFAGPVKPEWLAELEKTGVRVIQYLANNAYVVYGTPQQIAAVRQLVTNEPFAQWEASYLEDFRIVPQARLVTPAGEPSKVEGDEFVIQLVNDPEANSDTLDIIRALAKEIIREPNPILEYINVTVRIDPANLPTISARPDVFSVTLFIRPQLRDEVQGQIMAGNVTVTMGKNVPGGPGYLSWLQTKGFPQTATSYPIVDVVDDGIDNGTASPLHPDFRNLGLLANASRLIYNHNCSADTSADGRAGHGNINAGIIGSYNNLTGTPHVDANGYRRGLGISPYGRIAGTKIFRNNGSYSVNKCSNSDTGVVLASYNNGAGFTSNSWGADNAGAYDGSCQAYDTLTRDASAGAAGLQQMLHIFAAGNAGPGTNTLGSPGCAKNVLTVGATENVRDQGVNDGCNTPDADNFHDMATFSSRGPVAGGRIKPDLVAPGTHVQGPASQATGYDGTGVCDQYYPSGQTLYAWSSGTSHSTPAVAGAVSLLWNWLERVHNHLNPSPALLKALLINTARYLNGSGSGGNLPSNSQGYGHVDLGLAFDNAQVWFQDQATLFTATGQQFTTAGTIADSSKPLRITLAWTDAPGASGSSAPLVNNLDLEVTAGGNTYRGNVFNGAFSATGGSADTKNNVESVFLPAGVSGTIQVTVKAASISGNGVPGNASALDQDFAITVYNAQMGGTFIPASGAASLVSDSCGLGNGVLDSGESVTVQLALKQVGTSATVANVVGTLLPGGGVTSPSGPQNFGSLTLNGAEVARPFSFTVGSTCGGTVTAAVQVTGENGTSGTVYFSIPVGEWVNGVPAGFSNTAPITIVDNNNATPYPSNISVTGMTGRLKTMTVSCAGMNHTWISDIEMDLQSPSGEMVRIFDRAGSNRDFSNTTFTFSDSGAALPTSTIIPSGTYLPSNPLSGFAGINPNGVWQLYVRDRVSGDAGNINGGWSLRLQTEDAVCCGAADPHVTSLFSTVPNHSTAGSIPFTVVFSEPVTGFVDQGDVAVSRTGSVINSTVTFQQITPQNYTATVTGVSGDGYLRLRVNAGAVRALTGNLPNVGAGPAQVGLGTVPVRVSVVNVE